ncbi:hypothetical protein SAMN04488072_104129 [Lentibacillus halodurans]|uniref:Uncharacterized protein n=1 Tax=Lentibacillus halodurans TaxID=237679 RepID=A0A1I0X671_9BACI|nr:hypothetical protein [Lentibacillus halodurans]SFA95533.1 hypothetical protein SAMN04488072_104129 [Lentibacillus halodurans]
MMIFFLIVGMVYIFMANMFMGGSEKQQQQTVFYTARYEPRSVKLKLVLDFGLAGLISLGISAFILLGFRIGFFSLS